MRSAYCFALLILNLAQPVWCTEQAPPAMGVVPFRLAQADVVTAPHLQPRPEHEHVARLSTAGDRYANDLPTPATSAPSMRQEGANPVDALATDSDPRAVNQAGNMTGPAITVVSSLAIVVGCFLLFVWGMRRLMPRGTSSLPREAVELLGRTPLDARQHLQLIRVGNKLVLLAIGTSGAQSLCEVTDPREVDYLLHACHLPNLEPQSDSYREAFRQFGPDAAGGNTGLGSRRASARADSAKGPLRSVAGMS